MQCFGTDPIRSVRVEQNFCFRFEGRNEYARHISVPVKVVSGGRVEASLFCDGFRMFHINLSTDLVCRNGFLGMDLRMSLFSGTFYDLMLAFKPISAEVQVGKATCVGSCVHFGGDWEDGELVCLVEYHPGPWPSGRCPFIQGQPKLHKKKCCGGAKLAAVTHTCEKHGEVSEHYCLSCRDYPSV